MLKILDNKTYLIVATSILSFFYAIKSVTALNVDATSQNCIARNKCQNVARHTADIAQNSAPENVNKGIESFRFDLSIRASSTIASLMQSPKL